MGILLMGVITIIAAALLATTVQGTSTLGYSQHFQHYFRRPSSLGSSVKVKQISAAVPFSQDYDVEILKPMSQMPQRKHVPVYLVPQSSFHMYPTFATGFPHLSAIEIPLAEPMILKGPQCEAVAPMGFTVFSHGSFHPFYTVALLAPVPAGTHVSSDTPVIINVVYAVPKLPTLPSYHNVLTQVPANPSSTTTEKSPGIAAMTAKPGTLLPPEDDTDTVSIPLNDDGMDETLPFIDNDKESPYLQELRLESLERQLEELQNKIRKIKRLRNYQKQMN